jgi:hypothetical protein
MPNEIEMDEEKENESEEYMTAREAKEALGTSYTKMAMLLGARALPFVVSERDRRVKLIKRADLERVAAEYLKLHRPSKAREIRQQPRKTNNKGHSKGREEIVTMTSAVIFTQAVPNHSNVTITNCVASRGVKQIRRRGKSKPRATGWEGLRATDRAVYATINELRELINNTAERSDCTPPVTVPTLSRLSGVSIRQVQISVNKLIAMGYIEKLEGNSYQSDPRERGKAYRILRSPPPLQLGSAPHVEADPKNDSK